MTQHTAAATTRAEEAAREPLTLVTVICCYTDERATLLRRAIDSAVRESGPSDRVIVVVDHNRALLERLRNELSDSVALVANNGVQGLSDARNTGLSAAVAHARLSPGASRTVVVFLDDDAELRAGALDALRRRFDDPRVVAVGGAVHPRWEAPGRPRWFPTEFDWVIGCDYVGLPQDGAAIRNPIGAAMAVRAHELAEIDGFSSRLGRVGTVPAGCEETLMGIALRQANPQLDIVRTTDFAVDHTVPHARRSFAYFARRCWHEGRSKAVLARIAGSDSALASERNYVRRTLPAGFLGYLRSGRPTASAAMVAGLACTAAGYATGLVAARKTYGNGGSHAGGTGENHAK